VFASKKASQSKMYLLPLLEKPEEKPQVLTAGFPWKVRDVDYC
jgi:hypothetical protein